MIVFMQRIYIYIEERRLNTIMTSTAFYSWFPFECSRIGVTFFPRCVISNKFCHFVLVISHSLRSDAAENILFSLMMKIVRIYTFSFDVSTSLFSRFCIIRTSVTTRIVPGYNVKRAPTLQKQQQVHVKRERMRYSLVLAHIEIFHFVDVVVVVSCNSICVRFIY